MNIGDKVYTWRVLPFQIIEGEITEIKKYKDIVIYYKKFFDPISNCVFYDSCTNPYKTREEVFEAAKRVKATFLKNYLDFQNRYAKV